MLIRMVGRGLLKRRWATCGYLATSACAIGLGAALLSAAQPFARSALPYADHSRLVLIQPPQGGAGSIDVVFRQWAERRDLFEDIGGIGELSELPVRLASGVKVIRVAPITRGLLSTLYPDLAEQELALSASGLILTPAASELGREVSPGALLRTLDGTDVMVSGATHATFTFPSERHARLPHALVLLPDDTTLQTSSAATGVRTSSINCVARLREGVEPGRVLTALSVPGAGSIAVVLLDDWLLSTQRSLGLGLVGAGGLLIAFGLASVLVLGVSQGSTRSRDTQTMQALGASHWWIARAICAEVLMLGGATLVAANVVSFGALAAAQPHLPDVFNHIGMPGSGTRIVVWSTCLSCLFAAAYSLMTWSVLGQAEGLKGETSGSTYRSSASAIGLQCVLTLLVVGVSGQMLLSYHKLWSQDLGFEGDVSIASVSYRFATSNAETVARVVSDTLREIRREVGVEDVTVLTGPLLDDAIAVGGLRLQVAERRLMTVPRETTESFLTTLGTLPLAGRGLRERDDGRDAVLVNETFMRYMFPGMEPGAATGRLIDVAGGPPLEVKGIVRDVRERGLLSPAQPRVFRLLRSPSAYAPVNYLVRGRPDRGWTRRVTAVSPMAVIIDQDTLRRRYGETVAPNTLVTAGLGITAVALMVVTTITMLANVTSVVSARRREIAIRIALGADRGSILRLTLAGFAKAAILGAGFGVLLSWICVAWLQSRMLGITESRVLYGVTAALSCGLGGMAVVWMSARSTAAVEIWKHLRAD